MYAQVTNHKPYVQNRTFVSKTTISHAQPVLGIKLLTLTSIPLRNHIELMRQMSLPIPHFLELYHDLVIMNASKYLFITVANHEIPTYQPKLL